MYLSTTAIVLDKKDVNEYDRIFTFYTRDFGKIHAFGKSCNKPNAKFISLDYFTKFDVYLYYSNENSRVLRIVGGRAIENFSSFRKDLLRFGVGFFILEIVNLLTPHGEESSREFDFLLFILQELQHNDDVITLFNKFFYTEIALLGYGINFYSCLSCQRSIGSLCSEELYLSFTDGGLYCKNCKIKIETSGRALVGIKSEVIEYIVSLINQTHFIPKNIENRGKAAAYRIATMYLKYILQQEVPTETFLKNVILRNY
jgi:DNA repair protein RecO (recombination protein O)